MLKVSKYNLFVEKEDCRFVFNQLRSSILEIDEELSQVLKSCDIRQLNPDICEALKDQGFICEDSLREENVILARNKMQRFGSSHARITILPTMNCNFHCWYCYEHHIESVMSEESVGIVVKFCKDIIDKQALKTFQLDWFGGEPLLYFNQVVVPISEEIHKICEKKDISFLNTITTNGYLITAEMIQEMQKINLKTFQITLDGSKKFHNKVRFSKDVPNSFDTIVDNVVALCRTMPDVSMTVRINYTPKNIESIEEIMEIFPKDVRKQIEILPQLVWQFKKRDNYITERIKEIMIHFVKAGYKQTFDTLSFHHCYVENAHQYVINYDLSVFKCTARDFSPLHSIGKIDDTGRFIPSAHYFDYYVASAFENDKCMECHLLPSCLNTCLQKKIEGNVSSCDKDEIEESIINRVALYVTQQETN